MSIDHSVLVATAQEAQLSRWVGVTAIAFLVWDMLINLSEEITYIWRGPNTWVKWTYIFIRHFAIIALGSLIALGTNEHNHLHFTQQGCQSWIIFEAVASMSLVLAVEAVLFIRIYAIHERSRIILWATSTLFAAELITAITTVVLSIPQETYSFELGCVVTSTPPIFMASWIASLTFQTVLFILTVVKYCMSVTKHLGKQSILYMFVRDGVWAYAIMFIVLLLNLLMFQLKTSPLAPLCFKWALSVVSFTGAHMLLNLRRLGMSNHRNPSSSSSDEHTYPYPSLPTIILLSDPEVVFATLTTGSVTAGGREDGDAERGDSSILRQA